MSSPSTAPPAVVCEPDTSAGLRCRDATVRLSRRTVLEGIDLALCPGTRMALVGPNGAGKTTLLRLLAGLITPSRGAVELDGVDISQLTRRELATRVAWMPQRPQTHFPLSCLEAVLLGRSPHKRGLGLADEQDVERARLVMDELDVWSLAARPITAVSGGEVQRLMLARVLVQECGYLLLDEPTSAQDPLGQLHMLGVMADRAEKSRGLVVAVHDLNLALHHFDQVAVLRAGRLLSCAAPPEITRSGVLADAFGVRFECSPGLLRAVGPAGS